MFKGALYFLNNGNTFFTFYANRLLCAMILFPSQSTSPVERDGSWNARSLVLQEIFLYEINPVREASSFTASQKCITFYNINSSLQCLQHLLLSIP